MAEIHVEKKSRAPWVWALLVVVLLACVAWFLWQSGYIHLGMSPVHGQHLALVSMGGPHGA